MVRTEQARIDSDVRQSFGACYAEAAHRHTSAGLEFPQPPATMVQSAVGGALKRNPLAPTKSRCGTGQSTEPRRSWSRQPPPEAPSTRAGAAEMPHVNVSSAHSKPG